MDEPMTVAIAAYKLGVTPQTIYDWVNEEKLDRVPVEGRAVLITRESVEAVLNNQMQRGKAGR